MANRPQGNKGTGGGPKGVEKGGKKEMAKANIQNKEHRGHSSGKNTPPNRRMDKGGENSKTKAGIINKEDTKGTGRRSGTKQTVESTATST